MGAGVRNMTDTEITDIKARRVWDSR
ncbi:MAG: hypothetical protein JWQ82_1074, partial [Tardiphaga sp.]|nr:hypothetical protein [Tardiphaga sp.]